MHHKDFEIEISLHDTVFFHYNAASFMKKAIFSDGIWTTV